MRQHQCFKFQSAPAAKGVHEWLSMWSELIGRTTSSLEWAAGNMAFHGRMEFIELSHLKIFWASSTPFSVRRVAASPGVSFSRGIKVMLQLRGKTSVVQHGKTVELGQGQWICYDAGSPYEVFNQSDFEQITLMVPRESLAVRHDVKMAPLFRAHGAETGLGKVFWDFLKNVFKESDAIDPQCESSVASAVEGMLMQLLSTLSVVHTPTPVTQDVKSLILQHINDNLHDPELSLESMAHALGTTKRTLHRAFVHENESISERIWRVRIERCQAVIEHASTDWSITDLAFSHGFKDAAHFSRRFKQLAGVSPRAYQAMTRQLAERPA